MEANTREGGMTDRWDEAAERLEQELDGQDSPAACRAAFADELRSAFKAGQEDMRERAAADVTTQAAAGTYSVKAAAKMTAARIRSLPLKES